MKDIEVIVRSVRTVWQSSPQWAAVSGVCVVLNALLPLTLLWAMGRMVDVTLASIGSAGGFSVMAVLPAVLTFGAVLFATYAFGIITDWCTSELGERIRGHIAEAIQTKMAQVSYQTMQSPQFQTDTFRAVTGSTRRPVGIYFSALGALESLLTFLAMGAWLAGVSWWLPLVVLASGIPVMAVRLWDTREAYSLYRGLASDERRAQYYNNVLMQPQYAPEVRLFGLDEWFRRKYAALHARTSSARIGHGRRSAMRQIAASGLSTAAVIVVFVIVIVTLADDGHSVGALATCLMAIRRAEAAVTNLSRRSMSVHSQGLYVRQLIEFLNIGDEPVRRAAFPPHFSQINVDHVSFSYPGSSRKALSGLTLSIKRGEVVGIRGGNGSGKSTLVKLLCGLLKPDEGSVSIDGTELSDMAQEEVTRHISAVFQDFMVYSASARENIEFGGGCEDSPGRVRKAARAADIDTLIGGLPEGYDTELGNQFPGSEMFSRGEWQRLAQARVFYSHAEIIILDEAASALDHSARQTLGANIGRLRREGRTLIIVSHHSETLSLADRVIDI